MSTKDAYVKKLQSQLDEWSADIDLLNAKLDKQKAKANAVKSDAELEFQRKIEELRSMRKAANEKLLEVKNASDNAWKDLKVGVEHAWDTLDTALKSSISRFKS